MAFNLFGQPITSNGMLLGCDGCSLNKAPGIRKIKGLLRVAQQRVFVWGQCPGEHENERGLELVGPSGVLFWKTLALFGIQRPDCAVQNVVRCRPVDDSGYNRDPSKEELRCCSLYTEEALHKNQQSACVHIILGDVAGAQLLGAAFKKDRPVLWYEPWNAYVVLNWHPSYILRQGGEKAGQDYYAWRDRFRAVRAILDHPGRWGFLKAQKCGTVLRISEFDRMEKLVREEAARKRRVSFDIETGTVDGKTVLLMAGFGTGHWRDPKDWTSWQGETFSVVLDHPASGYTTGHAKEMQARTKKLIEDIGIKKSLANGSYDKNACTKMLDARLGGYDYDTQYGTFLRYSFLRACGLEPLTYRFFPEFADYKDVTAEWDGNFADAPIDRLTLRNGGDCAITQRLEQRFSPQVRQPLVKVYIHAGITLDKMEQRGPILDWEMWQKAIDIVPKMIAKLDRMLEHISGVSDFDCDSAPQVAHLLYDTLGIDVPEEGRTTNKLVLERLLAETGNATLDLVMKRRAIKKIKSTYLDGYARSARMHEDELRTIWWLTGAVTGRLRSGKGDKSGLEGVINFQNLHGNPLLQNLLVSDKNWRIARKR